MSTTEAPTLQNRRLRIRNARTNPSTLPPSSSSSGYYANANTNGFEGGSPGSVSVDRKSSFLEGDGWETDDQGDGEGEGEEEVDRKRRNRVSSSSLLSDGSTLVGGELDDGVAGGYKEDEDKDTTATTTTGGGGGIGRRSSNRRSPSPLLSPMGPVRAMTSPIPVRPMSMISTPSPYNYASTAHRRNRSNGGVGSGDSPGSSARYIDYLERQIADTVSQLQSYTSPSEGTSHAVKMRKLMAETRLLHSELTDWENKFSARVKEEVNARATIDKSLRVKIKNLEVKLEEAEYRYRTVEVDLEEARAKISDLKGVEEENRTLEFRIEALSELLADSTRLAQGVGVGRNGCSSAGSSGPGSIVFPKRCSSLGSSSSAPLSASLSRAQSRGAPAASTTGGKNTPVESRSRRASGEGSTCALEDYGITDPIEAVLCSMSELAATEGVEGGGEFEYADEFDETGSNPNTALVRTSPHHPPPAVLRNRRMRRFPSGSSAPKTLILPSAAVVTATTTTTTSPTLPTIRSFFNTPISDPASVIFSPPLSRPPSSSSTSSCCAPLSQISSSQKTPTPQTSLFAELARAQDSSSSDSEEDFPQDLLDPSAYDNTSAITEALTNPTPLVVKAISKVGESYISPQGTFLNAKRKAMDILGGVVGNRVSRHHHHHHHFLHTPPVAIPLRRRSSSSSSEKKKQGEKCHCSCHTPPPLPTTTAVTKRARSISAPLSFPQPVEEAVEHVWLWVRFMVALVVALGVAVREGPGVVVAVDGVGGIASRSRGGSSAGEGGFDGVGEEERCFAIRRLQEQQGGTAAEMRGRRRRGLGWGEERVRVWERMGGGDR